MRKSFLTQQEEMKGDNNMTIKEAMYKATQGGYHIHGTDGVETYYSGANSEFSVWTRKDNDSSFIVTVEETFLDPEFWHALGRGLGYEDTSRKGKLLLYSPTGYAVDKNIDWAEYTMLRFIDHLAEGKTPDSFFESLPCLEKVF